MFCQSGQAAYDEIKAEGKLPWKGAVAYVAGSSSLDQLIGPTTAIIRNSKQRFSLLSRDDDGCFFPILVVNIAS